MEEKKAFGVNNSLWSFFSFGNNFESFFRRKNSSIGFTLVELVLVIVMLGALAVLLFTFLDPLGQLAKSRDSRRKSDLEQAQRALELYYKDNGKYPAYTATTPKYRVNPPTGMVDWGDLWISYSVKLPKDPSTSSGRSYVYYASHDGQSYYLYASLERSSDPQACNSGGACTSLTSNGITSTACGTNCNYGISSRNVSP